MVDPKKLAWNACYGTLSCGSLKTSTPWFDTVEWDRRSWHAFNVSAATLISCVVEYASDPSQTLFGTLDGTTFANLGSAAIANGRVDSSPRWIRLSAAIASGSAPGTVVYSFAP